MVCVCWLVVCSAHLSRYFLLLMKCILMYQFPSVVVDGEDGDVSVVDNVVSSVEPLSNVDDSNVDDVIEDIAVVYVV